MNLVDVSSKIDAYFDSVTPEEVVAQFEEMGYEFEDVPVKNSAKVSFDYVFTILFTGIEAVKSSCMEESNSIKLETISFKGVTTISFDKDMAIFSNLPNNCAMAA